MQGCKVQACEVQACEVQGCKEMTNVARSDLPVRRKRRRVVPRVTELVGRAAACRARSRKEFIAKLGTVIEEADECEMWCALLQRCGIGSGSRLDTLSTEAGELRAIFVASRATAQANGRRT